jgi:hypothetical protein
MAGGKRRSASPKQLVEELKAKSTNDQRPEPVDGTVEDDLYVLSLKVSQLAASVDQMEKTIQSLSDSLSIARRQNIVVMDICNTLLNIPSMAFNLAFDNVLVYETKDMSDPQAHILSRQKALLKRFERVGVIDGSLHAT